MPENWLGVELRHLAALSAIHAERSFRGAADRLGYVQSAVSQQVSQLEALVGVRLVDRARGYGRPVRLTEAGSLLLEHAHHILNELDAAHADLRSLAEGEMASLRVGVVECVANRLLPSALLALARQHPSTMVAIEESSRDRDHFEQVERGDLDAAFGELPLEPGAFEHTEVFTDPCVLLLRCDDPRALADQEIGLAEIAEGPLIGLQSWPLMKLIEGTLRSAGHNPSFAMRADTNATVQALVRAGIGAAILPRLAVDEADPAVRIVDLRDLLPPRRMALYWHNGRRELAALEHFRQAVLATAHDIAPNAVPGREAAPRIPCLAA